MLIFHFIAEWITNGKNSLDGFKELEMFFFVKGYFQTDFFYIEEIDILLGMGKEGFEMVFKQDCNQTIWLRCLGMKGFW